MACLIVRIHIPGEAGALRRRIENDRSEAANGNDTEGWFSPKDNGLICVDDAYVARSQADDSFLVFDYVSVEDD